VKVTSYYLSKHSLVEWSRSTDFTDPYYMGKLLDYSRLFLKMAQRNSKVSTAITKALCPLFATQGFPGRFFRTLM